MDQIIKNKIIKMKENGDGYKKIATTLNLSIGSVRNALKEREDDSQCKHCGKKLVFTPGKKRKIFCSDTCRYAYWNEVKKNGR